jgi:hypothetical protein
LPAFVIRSVVFDQQLDVALPDITIRIVRHSTPTRRK